MYNCNVHCLEISWTLSLRELVDPGCLRVSKAWKPLEFDNSEKLWEFEIHSAILVFHILFLWHNLKHTASRQCKFAQLQWYGTLCHHARDKYSVILKRCTKMTAEVICYIGFSIYNFMEKTV